MNVILYTTNCPKCKVLESKLLSKNIPFEKSNDIDKMIEMGFMSAPVLDVDGSFMNFTDAVKWVNER